MWRDSLIDRITDELAIELGITETEILRIKVKNAVNAVMRTRNYKSYHTDTFIEDDIVQYEENIHNLALYDYNQIGVEGQSSHDENGYNRTWHKREDCLIGVIPFV